ncbi:sialate O-acetylesterase [Polaribacter aestuariivivens]|uniref:sialate O-acetylesterase n=1 Tax=Polaribacter aestuariivivens TaxID=2304626 RepID=UPI003F4957A1
MKLSIIFSFLFTISLYSQTILPSVFGDNMVLQQKDKVAIWGKDLPNTQIYISTSWGVKLFTKVDVNGLWKITIKTKKASFNSESITIKGSNTITLKNILIGEIWLCSGQSNMDMPLKGLGKSKVLNAEEYLEKAENKYIRLFNNPRAASTKPSFKTGGKWVNSSRTSANKFSAIGFIFALELYEKLKVPIGIIETSWGGTRIESWIPKEKLLKYKDIKFSKTLAKEQKKQKRPTFLYNAMIHPFQDYKVKGFLWYQGESNRTNPKSYKSLMKDLIDAWRTQWNHKKLPFYFVQIAPFNYVKYKKGKLNYDNFIRESQLKIAQEIKNTGLVVTTDVGDCKDIHPSKKGTVAKRLANWALAEAYNFKDIFYKSAEVKSVKVKGNKVTIKFKFYNKDHFIETKDLKSFLIAGADKVFYPAKAIINKNNKSIVLQSSRVTKPIAVRYGFEACFESNLQTKSGLPISVFRTDTW